MTRRVRPLFGTLLPTLLILIAARASGQAVGSISGIEPTADIGRSGEWTPAAAGAPVHIGDVLRTGRPGRLSVVFQDDSVITVGPGSELVINEQVFAPKEGTVRTVLQLVQGKIRSVVSEYYQGTQGGFEVKTPTALAGVRGTDFVVVHDPAIEVTEVVGVSGRVAVNSIFEPERHGVIVTSRELTVVARGGLPQTPQRLTEKLFRQYIEGLQFLVGPAGSLPLAQSIVTSQSVPQQDTIAESGSAPASTGSLLAPVPGESPYGNNSKSSPALGSQNASAVLGQPAPVILSGSGLSIDF